MHRDFSTTQIGSSTILEGLLLSSGFLIQADQVDNANLGGQSGELGLPVIQFHDLRHTAASLMLNHGTL